MTATNKSQEATNRNRANILQAIKNGCHMRLEIENAIDKSHLSNALGHMVKIGMIHTRQSDKYDKNCNRLNEYWPGSGGNTSIHIEEDIDDGMLNLLAAWPFPIPNKQLQGKIYTLTDERHNNKGLNCSYEINIQSSMR